MAGTYANMKEGFEAGQGPEPAYEVKFAGYDAVPTHASGVML